ncbi:MAG: heme exporter protein CcmD [Pseudomonadota bacterium]
MDLGQYAFEVLAAYGASFALLGAVVATTLIRARRVRRALEEAEARKNG